jgi:hypothetical protein
MAKDKNANAVSTDVVDPRYMAVLADYSDKEKEDFMKLSPEEKEAEVTFLLSLQASATAATDIVMADIQPEKSNIQILNAGGPGLRAGTKIKAFLHGTVFVHTKEFKENWTEIIGANGTKFYQNAYLLFSGIDGKEFGIWSGATLRDLEKVPTKSSDPTISKNPLVEINYLGKIEGKERLEAEFGIKLKTGNSCHVFKNKVEAGFKVDAYKKGCINPLNSSEPFENVSGVIVTREEATKANYERLMALQTNTQAAITQ